MAAFATAVGKSWDGNITGATTPVNYLPSSIDANGVATWYAANSILDARQKLSMSVRQPSKGSQVARVQVKLVHPVMDSVDTSLKIGECLVNVELVFPKRADQTARELIVGHALYFLSEDPQFIAAIQSLESVY